MTSRWAKLTDIPAHFCPRRAARGLPRWFASAQGEFVLQSELSLLESLGEGLSGYHLMQLSYALQDQPLYSFGHTHCFSLGVEIGRPAAAIAEYESLPLPSETIDTGVLHHVLEYSENPHRVLNEASRVIIPGGHLVLVMFNPVSLLGLLRWPVRPFSDEPVWHYRGLRSSRIIDWLQLLHFQPVAMGMQDLLFPIRCHKVPQSAERVRRKIGNIGLLFGAITVVVARKMVLRPSFGNGFPQFAKQAVGLKLQSSRNRGVAAATEQQAHSK